MWQSHVAFIGEGKCVTPPAVANGADWGRSQYWPLLTQTSVCTWGKSGLPALDLGHPSVVWSGALCPSALGWLQRITTPHGVVFWLWSLDLNHTQKVLESELWHHATTGKACCFCLVSIFLMYADIWELAVLALARIMCAYIHSQNGPAILAQAWFSTEKLAKNPPTHALVMAAVDLTMAPPDDIPGPLQAGIDKLSAPLKTLLMGKVVPYIIQNRLGEDNYVTIEDLADRWDTPKVQGPMVQRSLVSVMETMASMPRSQPMHPWSSTKWWERPKIFSKGLPTLLQHQELCLGEECHLLRYFARGPSSRRSTWPSGRHPSLSIEIKEVKPCWNGSTDSAAKGRSDTYKPSTSSVPFLRKESGRSRHVERCLWMDGKRKKKKKKRGPIQPPGGNWNVYTWCSATPFLCAWRLFLNFLSLTWRKRIWTPSMIGFMAPLLQAAGLLRQTRRSSMRREMRGERCMSWCTQAWPLNKLWLRSKRTASFGCGKCMKGSFTNMPKERRKGQGSLRRANWLAFPLGVQESERGAVLSWLSS